MLYKKININSKIVSKKIEHNELAKRKEKIKNLFFFHPLGTEKSFIIEIFKFSKNNWSKIFILNKYIIIDKINGPITYSGFSIFKNSGYKIRKFFAKKVPSSYIFIIKKLNYD
jgi:hypothetical protein